MSLPNSMTIGPGPYDNEPDNEVIFTPESIAKDLNLTYEEVRRERGSIIRKWTEGTDLIPVFLSWSWHRNDDEFFVDTLTINIDGCSVSEKFRYELALELDEQMYIVYDRK